MPRKPIVALVSDLIFASKITGVAAHLEISVQVLRRQDDLIAAAGIAAAALLDLSIEDLDAPDLIRRLKASAPQLPVVAFLPHVAVQLASAARQAGADYVLARSAFVKKLPDLLRDLAKD